VTVTIIGNGQMGLVMADALVAAGSSVRLWGPFPEHLEPLARTRRASDRLADFSLDETVLVTPDAGEALDGADLLVSAIPAQHVRSVWESLAVHRPEAPVVSVSRGIERGGLHRPTQVLAAVLGGDVEGPGSEAETRCCVLSGPTIAAELARRLPATMVAAGRDGDLVASVQRLFAAPWLRIYGSGDPIGVELAGAAKNVIALAAGMIDGLGAGDNAKSALLARGLSEIARLGLAMGAEKETFFGIAGVGDLATTCFSPSGRNRIFGERLARGESRDVILGSMADVVEGVPTAEAIGRLADRHDVEMPICRAVAAILFEGLGPAEAIERLMAREPKAEAIG